MNKKKDNTKRNLAIGASTLLAGGLAISNAKNIQNLARKAYNSLNRLGKKRGKYKKSQTNKYEVWDTPSLSEPINGLKTPIKPKSQKLLSPKQRTKKQIDNSAKIKKRLQKLEYDPDKNYAVVTDLQDTGLEVRESLSKLKQNKTDPDFMDAVLNSGRNKKRKSPENIKLSNREYLLQEHKRVSNNLKQEVKRLMGNKEYSKNIHLISEFTIM